MTEETTTEAGDQNAPISATVTYNVSGPSSQYDLRAMFPNVHQRILAVQRDVHRAREDKVNSHLKHRYATEASIYAALKPALIEHGLALTPSVKRIDRDSHGVDVWVEYELTNVDDQEDQVILMAVGRGSTDTNGVKAAMTGAARYFASKTFLVETGDDDEALNQAANTKAASPAAPDLSGWKTLKDLTSKILYECPSAKPELDALAERVFAAYPTTQELPAIAREKAIKMMEDIQAEHERTRGSKQLTIS